MAVVNPRMFSPVYFVLLAVHLAVIAEVLPTALHPFTKLSLVAALLVFVGTQWRRFAAHRGWKLLTAGLVLSLLVLQSTVTTMLVQRTRC